MTRVRQEKLFDEKIDNPTAAAADRLVELLDEQNELVETIEKQQTKIIGLMKKNSRVVFVHGGRRFNLTTKNPVGKLVVKEEKEKKQRGILLTPPAEPAKDDKKRTDGEMTLDK